MFLSTLLLCAAPTLAPQDPVAHTLTVKLEPEIHRLSVTDRVTLPAPLAVAGTELTLNERLEITESTPVLQRLGAEEGRARYALEAAPEGGVLNLTYAGTFDFGLSDQKEEYTRGFRETLGTVGPEGVYLDGGSGWFPSFGDEMITFTLEVEGPENWHVISQGNGSSDVERDWRSGTPRVCWSRSTSSAARWSSSATSPERSRRSSTCTSPTRRSRASTSTRPRATWRCTAA